ncbi:hypothetical protein TNIN_356341 [Trichonephila inaurata madagascariensis]|uniref:Uncharacterized protein n=1 Tax=Trichonephila inaurata madagascariensis TaxID=2747483 RepID=A0A8X6MGN0_9ARAC|nr:hypothetical protein TNIN_356341 [Trichonephila inaurata madagascariensis]
MCDLRRVSKQRCCLLSCSPNHPDKRELLEIDRDEVFLSERRGNKYFENLAGVEDVEWQVPDCGVRFEQEDLQWRDFEVLSMSMTTQQPKPTLAYSRRNILCGKVSKCIFFFKKKEEKSQYICR